MNNQKKISLYVLTIMILFGSLSSMYAQSIGFIPGSGRDVTPGFSQNRDRDFYYHRNIDEQHWYGTSKWAVRFNFSAIYDTTYAAQFKINKVRVYFPTINMPANMATIELYSDLSNIPGILLATKTDSVSTNSVVDNWKEFTISPSVQRGIVWVILTYNTTSLGPFISSSIGDGTHSFFFNTTSPAHYYQNLALAGLNSEFLISVVGNYELSNTDIELFSFDLKPSVSNNSTVRPEFFIYNNSTTNTVSEARINLTISSPIPDFAIQDTITITRNIPPQSDLFVEYDNEDYQQYAYQIPENPTQIIMNATLHSEYDSTDAIFNNSISKAYNIFADPLPIRIVENFIQQDSTQSFIITQHNYATEEIKFINYYPTPGDTNYAIGAVQRFNWYNLMGYPMTIVGGDDIITGFVLPAYSSVFSEAVNRLITQNTFLENRAEYFSLPQPFNQLTLYIDLVNPNTYLFTEPSLTSQSRFFAALCKRDVLYNEERFTFKRWGAFADTISTNYPMGIVSRKQFNVAIGDIPISVLNSQYVIIYWIQHLTTKEILYSNLLPLDAVVSASDEVAPVIHPKIALSPNPVMLGGNLKITIPDSYAKSKIKYSIYNLKGQLLKQNVLYPGQKNLSLSDDIKTAGIYLIRFSLTNPQNRRTKLNITKKIVIY